MIAPTASMNPTVVTTGPEFGLDLGRSISAVGEHIIASVALVQQPIQFLAVVHGSIGHGIMPDQLVLGVRVHMVLLAEEVAACLLGPARIAVLLPHFGGLLLPPRGCAPSLQLGVLVTTVPLRRHQHDTGVDDLPAGAPCSPWPQDAGRSGQTASRSFRPWQASRGTAKASWRLECCPRSRAPESARTTAGRAPDIPPARPTDC